MLLVRPLEPVPQDSVHAEKADQAETIQSMGQAWMLQRCSSEVWAQTTPPLIAEVVTERVRVWEPEPQEREHADQLVKPDTTQSTGQVWALQTRCSSRVGHVSPP
jgi:hypothetical protein